MALSTMHMPATNGLTVLELPTEVRGMIYSHLCELLELKVYFEWDDVNTRSQRSLSKLRKRNLLNLLLSCKTIYKEVRDSIAALCFSGVMCITKMRRYTDLEALPTLQRRIQKITVDDNPPFDWAGLDLDDLPQLTTIEITKDVITYIPVNATEADIAENEVDDGNVEPVLRRRIAAFSSSLPAHNQTRFKALKFVFRTTHFQSNRRDGDHDEITWSMIVYKHKKGVLTHKEVDNASFDGEMLYTTEDCEQSGPIWIPGWHPILRGDMYEDGKRAWIPEDLLDRSLTTSERRLDFNIHDLADETNPTPYPDERFYNPPDESDESDKSDESEESEKSDESEELEESDEADDFNESNESDEADDFNESNEADGADKTEEPDEPEEVDESDTRE